MQMKDADMCPSSSSGQPRENPNAVLISVLVRALGDPRLRVPSFLSCAEALRNTVAQGGASPSWKLAVDAQEVLLRSLGKAAPPDAVIVACLTDLEEAVANGRRPAEEEIAERRHIDPAHLGRLLQVKTGRGFRQWRSAFVMKAGVRYLVESDEQVKQIACRRLGFSHESQFDHEFRDLCGLTPTEFRRQWRAGMP